MKCEEVHSLIKSYYNETLDEYLRIKIHHHLVDCKSCTEEYEMWLRGEELMQLVPANHLQQDSFFLTSGVLQNVMGRIEEEEKWANPSVKKNTSFLNRLKVILTFIVSMALITAILFFATSFTTEIESYDGHVVRLDMMGDSWKIEELVMNDNLIQEEMNKDETAMDFQVVASLSDPIIYTLAEEKKEPPYILIFTLFFSLMVVLGLSWITRTEDK